MGTVPAKSTRILLVRLTDVASEGAVFTGQHLNVGENSGGSRYLARVGRAEVSLQLDHPERYAVWALATDGKRRVRIQPTVREGRLSFTADVARDRKDGTFLYEVEQLSGSSSVGEGADGTMQASGTGLCGL